MWKTSDESGLRQVLKDVFRRHKGPAFGILLSVVGAVVTALLPPLVLEHAVNLLTTGVSVPFSLAVLYFILTILVGLFDAGRESLLIAYGQMITHEVRGALCRKLSRLPAAAFVRQEPGKVVSRFVGDVDTLEALFTTGIVSMFADTCKVVGIFVMLFTKNRGLALVLLLLLPFVFAYTRRVQKRMLASQMDNRVAVGRVTNHVPETIRCIRTIHALQKEKYMCRVYDEYITDSYDAMERTNFYDAVYSPVILIINALVVAVVMLLSATGVPEIRSFFGMSVGTSVAVISYIASVFAPLESIGMEIQTIQSAIAGVRRIDEFLSQEERWTTDSSLTLRDAQRDDVPCIQLENVDFGYDEKSEVLHRVCFTVKSGEQITLTGRTGAGKSTVFKLLLGEYQPTSGKVLLYGKDAGLWPDCVKRKLIGIVEQSFWLVPGTVLEQITLFDESITPEMAISAAKTVGIHESIQKLPFGYETICTPSIFSQGQWQLLSIARAIAAEPRILLLDEITANLDAETEQAVLSALQKASAHRTVLSISHRLYRKTGGRQLHIQ